MSGDGSERVLDWRKSADPRNSFFPVSAVLPSRVGRRVRRWRAGPVLDQGAEGACVGFGWTGELMSTPVGVKIAVPDAFARQVYRLAQRIDEWPGESYSGTSVLAGAKVVARNGYVLGYRWATSVDDVVSSVVEFGPVVIGVPWTAPMFHPRPSGIVDIDGGVLGGHCVVITGYHPGQRFKGEGWLARHEVLRFRNSWGTGYGRGGDGYFRVADFETLLADGEACVPMLREFGTGGVG